MSSKRCLELKTNESEITENVIIMIQSILEIKKTYTRSMIVHFLFFT